MGTYIAHIHSDIILVQSDSPFTRTIYFPRHQQQANTGDEKVQLVRLVYNFVWDTYIVVIIEILIFTLMVETMWINFIFHGKLIILGAIFEFTPIRYETQRTMKELTCHGLKSLQLFMNSTNNFNDSETITHIS